MFNLSPEKRFFLVLSPKTFEYLFMGKPNDGLTILVLFFVIFSPLMIFEEI